MDKKEIVEKIKESENVKIFDCGIYASFDAEILRKYTDERIKIETKGSWKYENSNH